MKLIYSPDFASQKTMPFVSKFIAVFLLLLQLVGAVAQNAVEFNLDGIKLEKKFSNTPSLKFKPSIGKASFHGRVGGVSFEQIASPDADLENIDINIDYDKQQNDGNRLKVLIGSGTDSIYFPELPDWQLAPIAKFANDVNSAVVTRIANGDQRYYETETGNIQYHEAFQNNLLGLRLLQADMIDMIGSNKLWKLPKVSNITNGSKEYLAADSEKNFIPNDENEKYYNDLGKEIKNEIANIYTGAYILTDWGQEIKFGVQSNRFYISGEPYYLFTTTSKYNTKKSLNYCKEINAISSNAVFVEDTLFKQLKSICKNDFYSWNESKIENLIEYLKYKDEYKEISYKNYIIQVQKDFASERYSKDKKTVENTYEYKKINRMLKEELSLATALKIESSIQYWTYSTSVSIDTIKLRLEKLLNQDNLSKELLTDTNFIELKKYVDTCRFSNNYTLSIIDKKIKNLSYNHKVYTDAYYFIKKLSKSTERTQFTNNDFINMVKNNKLVRKNNVELEKLEYVYFNENFKEDEKIELKTCASEKFQNSIVQLYEYNPAVYDATIKVMRYAAFFRYIKNAYPAKWKIFYKKVEKLKPLPSPSKDKNSIVNQPLITPDTMR